MLEYLHSPNTRAYFWCGHGGSAGRVMTCFAWNEI